MPPQSSGTRILIFCRLVPMLCVGMRDSDALRPLINQTQIKNAEHSGIACHRRAVARGFYFVCHRKASARGIWVLGMLGSEINPRPAACGGFYFAYRLIALIFAGLRRRFWRGIPNPQCECIRPADEWFFRPDRIQLPVRRLISKICRRKSPPPPSD